MLNMKHISGRHPELVSGSNQMLKQVQHDKHLCATPFLYLSLCHNSICASAPLREIK